MVLELVWSQAAEDVEDVEPEMSEAEVHWAVCEFCGVEGGGCKELFRLDPGFYLAVTADRENAMFEPCVPRYCYQGVQRHRGVELLRLSDGTEVWSCFRHADEAESEGVGRRV